MDLNFGDGSFADWSELPRQAQLHRVALLVQLIEMKRIYCKPCFFSVDHNYNSSLNEQTERAERVHGERINQEGPLLAHHLAE